jgi:ABC-type glycerol-3-phosphate transport system substrate-binding protein
MGSTASGANGQVIHPLGRRAFLRGAGAAVLVGIGGGLAACAKTTTADTTTNKSTSTVKQSVTLNVPVPHAPTPAVTAAVVAAFQKTHPGIQLSVPGNPPSAQSLVTQVEAGQAPDVFATTTPFIFSLFGSKAIIDLSHYLAQSPIAKEFPSAILDATTLPTGQLPGIASKAATNGLYYNVDAFQAAHVSLPTPEWTQDDYRSAILKMTNANRKIYGGGGDPWKFSLENAIGWGSAWVPASNPVTLNYNSEILAGETFIQQLRYQDKSWMPGSIMNWSTSFPTGQMMTIRQNSYSLLSYGTAIGSSFKWNTTTIPKGPSRRAVDVSLTPLTITSSSKNPDAAWTYIEWCLSSPDYWNIIIPAQGTIPPVLSQLSRWQSLIGQNSVLKGVDLSSWTLPLTENTAITQPVFKYNNSTAWNWWGNAVGNCMTGTPPKGEMDVATQFQAAATATDAYEAQQAKLAVSGSSVS